MAPMLVCGRNRKHEVGPSSGRFPPVVLVSPMLAPWNLRSQLVCVCVCVTAQRRLPQLHLQQRRLAQHALLLMLSMLFLLLRMPQPQLLLLQFSVQRR